MAAVKDLNIFVLMGQSNMSGRGVLGDVPALTHPDVYMWREGRWLPAEEPLHIDKPEIAGIGLGMSFAVEVANTIDLSPIGLVPCAVGGSPLRRWMLGEDLYDRMISESKAALKNGTLAGLLWHQGEHDSCGEGMATTYAERLETMIAQVRSDLAANDVPFIAGELAPFLTGFNATKYFEIVNRALCELENRVPGYCCVAAEGMTDIGDSLHLDAVSLRELGVRYARAFCKMKEERRT